MVGQSVAWAAAQGLLGQIKPYLQNKSDGLKRRGLHQGEREKTAACIHFLCSSHNHPLGLQRKKKKKKSDSVRKEAGYQTLGKEEKKDGEKEERREKTIRGRLGSHDLADPSLTPDSPTGAFPSNLDSHCLPTRLTERRSGVEQPSLLSGQADGPGPRGSRTPGLTRPEPSGPKETSESED